MYTKEEREEILWEFHRSGLSAPRRLQEPAAFPEQGGLVTLMWTVPGGARETGGPYMRDPRHPRHFTDEFKRQIVDLHNAGKPKREILLGSGF